MDRQILTWILEVRGYLVMASKIEHQVGDIIKNTANFGSKLDAPFRIMRQTSREDYLEQYKIINDLGGAPKMDGVFYFYEVATD